MNLRRPNAILVLCFSLLGCQNALVVSEIHDARQVTQELSEENIGVAILPFKFAGKIDEITIKGNEKKITLTPKNTEVSPYIYRFPEGKYCFSGFTFTHDEKKVVTDYKTDLCFEVRANHVVFAPELYEQGKKMVFMDSDPSFRSSILKQYKWPIFENSNTGSLLPTELTQVGVKVTQLPGKFSPQHETKLVQTNPVPVKETPRR